MTNVKQSISIPRPVEEDSKLNVEELRRGDYMIHILIEKAKELDYVDDVFDPMVEISCMGQKKYTTSKKDTTKNIEINWSEHLFLEYKNVEKRDAEEGKILVRLLNKGFFKDDLIGEFEFDISFVYLRDKHSMLHQWVALSNPQSEYTKITGYLKLSIAVACTGDNLAEIKDDTAAETDTNVMMPP